MSAPARSRVAPRPAHPMARLHQVVADVMEIPAQAMAGVGAEQAAAAIGAMDRQFELSALFAANAGYAEMGGFTPQAEAQSIAAAAAWAAARLTFFTHPDCVALCRRADGRGQFPLRRRLAAAAFQGQADLDRLARSLLSH